MIRSIFGTAAVLLACCVAGAEPVGTSFTYQGALKDNGGPANGNYEMQFSLWDSPRTGPLDPAGTQIGPTLTFDGAGGNPPAISVTDGLFTAQLDFGDVAEDRPIFLSDARWLEVAVRPAGAGGAYFFLYPRQRLTRVPFAQTAARVEFSVLFTGSRPGPLLDLCNTGEGGAARLCVTNPFITALQVEHPFGFALEVNGGSRFAQMVEFNQPSGAPFSVVSTALVPNLNAERLGGNDGVFYRNAGNLNAGTLSDLRLSSNVPRLNAAQTFSAQNLFVRGDPTPGPAARFERHNGSNSNAIEALIDSPGGFALSAQAAATSAAGVIRATAIGSVRGVVAESVNGDAISASASGTGAAVAGVASANGLAGRFTGEVRAIGEFTKEYATGATSRCTPIAFGFVNADGTLATGTPNVTSTWNASMTRYEITIDGVVYSAPAFVACVTPQISGDNPPRLSSTSSVSGRLIVRMYDLAGNQVQQAFQFVVFAP